MPCERRLWDKWWTTSQIHDLVKSAHRSGLLPVLNRFLRKKGKILEAGCGLAQWVIYFSRRGYQIEGIDFSEEAIKMVKEYDPSLPVFVADVTALPYENNRFTAVLSFGVLEHFEEGPEKALKELYRVLQPGGLLIVNVPYLNIFRKLSWLVQKIHTKRERPDQKFFQYMFSRGEIVHSLKQTGFSTIYVKTIDCFTILRKYAFSSTLLKSLAKLNRIVNPKPNTSPFAGHDNSDTNSANSLPINFKFTLKNMVRQVLGLLRKSTVNLLDLLIPHTIVLVAKKIVKEKVSDDRESREEHHL